MTLQEYYESKGISVPSVETRNQPVKKQEISAEWIKKEKLQLLETKEDKKNETRNKMQVIQRSNVVQQQDESTFEMLGFHGKVSQG